MNGGGLFWTLIGGCLGWAVAEYLWDRWRTRHDKYRVVNS